MAIINYTDQLKYAGKGYLDAKMMPVKTVDDLKAISLTQRFEGLTITVLNNGNPQDYWLVGGVTNKHWVQKNSGSNVSVDDLKTRLENLIVKVSENESNIATNTANIEENKKEISSLKEQIDEVSFTPDGSTIDIVSSEDKKQLQVKLSEKAGNIIKVEEHNGENGLYASIPVFYEDEQLV